MTSRKNNIMRRSFTLIELLVVSSILIIIVGVMLACLSGGIRVWEVARRMSEGERDLLVGGAIIRKDLRNAFSYFDIPFKGDSARITFPGYAADDEGKERIGVVQYKFDAPNRRLERKEWVFPGVEDEIPAEIMMTKLVSLRFQYQSMAEEKAGEWQDAWSDPSNHPGAVSIEYMAENGGSVTRWRDVLVLPESGRIDEKK
jgi:hypothetical protein